MSAGCAHCYAEKFQVRFGNDIGFSGAYRSQGEPFLDREVLAKIAARRKPTKFFLCDMTDMFGEWVEQAWIDAIFKTIDQCQRHTFQILTKRPEHLLSRWPMRLQKDGTFAQFRSNCWIGTSVERQDAAYRVHHLSKCRRLSPVRFLSCEPLIGPLKLTEVDNGGGETYNALNATVTTTGDHTFQASDAHPINWVIIGGESGPKARPCELDWIEKIMLDCVNHSVPVFVKQMGRTCLSSSMPPIEDGRVQESNLVWDHGRERWKLQLSTSHGDNMDEWPSKFRVREYPYVPA